MFKNIFKYLFGGECGWRSRKLGCDERYVKSVGMPDKLRLLLEKERSIKLSKPKITVGNHTHCGVGKQED